MTEIKHKATIDSIFECFFESWMDEDDKKNFVDCFLNQSGKTMADLDNDIEIGIRNGYSVEQQVSLIKMVIKPVLSEDKQ
ncbi:hypothetical protein [Vibrio sp. D431a]|uniref:hypothetical protein n=1 Tax=Vibrio sp. D431a TaxID=2837388 RepID=UPI002556267F|nr:hypothetical protein [Vibrio sp. D431a]MDK9790620.1 hypothetical protein [Vibrio sp. D431a]